MSKKSICVQRVYFEKLDNTSWIYGTNVNKHISSFHILFLNLTQSPPVPLCTLTVRMSQQLLLSNQIISYLHHYKFMGTQHDNPQPRDVFRKQGVFFGGGGNSLIFWGKLPLFPFFSKTRGFVKKILGDPPGPTPS